MKRLLTLALLATSAIASPLTGIPMTGYLRSGTAFPLNVDATIGPVVVGPGIEFPNLGPFSVDLDDHTLTITLTDDWTPVAYTQLIVLVNAIAQDFVDFSRTGGTLAFSAENTFPNSTVLVFESSAGISHLAGESATYQVSMVPEPGTFALFGLGAVAFIVRKLRT